MTVEELKKLLIREGYKPDDGIATHLLHAHETTRLPLSDCLACVAKETGFRNLFGSDAVRNPIKGGKVTWRRYKLYKQFRKRGWGMQGIGPCQLTWFELQDQADKAGGCHKPYPNMIVGFRLLRELIAQHGREKGAARYNGVGDAAEAYGRDYVKRQKHFHDLLI
jgi:hypothetical protein